MAGTPLTELNQPLGQGLTASKGKPWGRWIAFGCAGLVGLVWVSILLIVAIRRDPDGGQPIATARIEQRVAPASALPASVPVAQIDPAAAARPQSSARQLENEAGVTVVRPGADVPGAVVITIPDNSGTVTLAPAPDNRLFERTRHGLLPKIGPDGATPAQVYARPAGPPPAGKVAGRIAILVGGLGISPTGTTDAIAKLPGQVSLAFAPYGTELERTVQRARGEGHEVFLQLPMEPFDYPDSDPGPHTLLTGPKSADNLERLHWALGRFTGYVGIVNFLGGRLTSDETALSPILRELAGRGLMVVDDGSSARSLLASSAARAQIPAMKIDRVVDMVARPDAIDKELAAIEAMARDQGVAVISASALPVSIERIARWTQTLEAKGLVLVPMSAARGLRSPKTTGSLR
ncbi:MAG: divergent polysaccharide deacetylase family protein [Bosea sp. (in: a-proteobacteria)]|uniref:divergent polysaccharide deacetylase family protein n=1 Tax=Bosea sp. (in: a-proteobacteria) TaxID=1871050 RepID=UPI0027344BA2|nr:divergent polysaccharide deacetylase family protein [Bosea sp. (in: a-proteobacteria)]MDP3256008.1 divergent polysaccharide deacetylase family protein [Bosea sp. (in: a-proteobacteria)]MDP3319407.1 divergent polysaccharide deacetylase family protein [Bosea sp. (in: a-proteobacteria)]